MATQIFRFSPQYCGNEWKWSNSTNDNWVETNNFIYKHEPFQSISVGSFEGSCSPVFETHCDGKQGKKNTDLLFASLSLRLRPSRDSLEFLFLTSNCPKTMERVWTCKNQTGVFQQPFPVWYINSRNADISTRWPYMFSHPSAIIKWKLWVPLGRYASKQQFPKWLLHCII